MQKLSEDQAYDKLINFQQKINNMMDELNTLCEQLPASVPNDGANACYKHLEDAQLALADYT